MIPVYYHLNIVAMLVKQSLNVHFYLIFHRIKIDLYVEVEVVHDRFDRYYYQITMDEVMKQVDSIELIKILRFELVGRLYWLFQYIL
jgi:hypothetical protein